MAEGSRRFPAPWRADKVPGGYVIRDANGQALAYIHSRENEDEARQAKVLTKDVAADRHQRRVGCRSCWERLNATESRRATVCQAAGKTRRQRRRTRGPGRWTR